MMDPAAVKEMQDFIDDLALKTWGPISEEAQEFVKIQKAVDFEKILGRKTTMWNHLRVDDELVLTPMLVRGLFEAQKLNLTKDDVLVSSFPKCGTTWLQEIVFLVINDCDFAIAKSEHLDERSPTLEYPECSYKTLQELPPPRVLKSHIPYSKLPGGDKKEYKIIYMTRNPKDVAVSMHHFYKMIKPLCYDGTVQDMLKIFLADACIYAPFPKHALEFWEHVKDGNVLFVKYEDLHQDAAKEVRRVAEFLGKKFTDEQIDSIVRATSFQEMAEQGTKNHSNWDEKKIKDPNAKFMRKGKVGDWKLNFDEEMNNRFEEYIKKHFGNSDLTYDYE